MYTQLPRRPYLNLLTSLYIIVCILNYLYLNLPTTLYFAVCKLRCPQVFNYVFIVFCKHTHIPGRLNFYLPTSLYVVVSIFWYPEDLTLFTYFIKPCCKHAHIPGRLNLYLPTSLYVERERARYNTITVGVRQECVHSPTFFNLFIERIV